MSGRYGSILGFEPLLFSSYFSEDLVNVYRCARPGNVDKKIIVQEYLMTAGGGTFSTLLRTIEGGNDSCISPLHSNTLDSLLFIFSFVSLFVVPSSVINAVKIY